MSNVIAVLETMGQNAALRHAGQAELCDELIARRIGAEVQWAILQGDSGRLESMLGTPTIVCCVLDPGKEEEEEPSRDDDEITTQSAIRVVATA